MEHGLHLLAQKNRDAPGNRHCAESGVSILLELAALPRVGRRRQLQDKFGSGRSSGRKKK